MYHVVMMKPRRVIWNIDSYHLTKLYLKYVRDGVHGSVLRDNVMHLYETDDIVLMNSLTYNEISSVACPF